MTAVLDPMVANARIVTPEEAALDVIELLEMKVMLMAARRDGVEAHVVQFPDGVAVIAHADPNDTAAWYALLSKAHAAALAGHIGPLPDDDTEEHV